MNTLCCVYSRRNLCVKTKFALLPIEASNVAVTHRQVTQYDVIFARGAERLACSSSLSILCMSAVPNTSTSVSETYDESRVWMEATLHDHPHIGMCRAGELQSTQHALDIFARVVQLGLEGIVIVNPRVRYGAKDYVDRHGDLVGTFFKLKKKIVLPGQVFQIQEDGADRTGVERRKETD